LKSTHSFSPEQRSFAAARRNSAMLRTRIHARFAWGCRHAPVLNKRAVELAMQAALALNCTVHEHSRFARKNYFYPDLPKGYQITQYELPLATAGHIEIENRRAKNASASRGCTLKKMRRKICTKDFKDSATKGYVDYNRCGSPLSEIVSEPDMRTPEEAYQYLTTLRQILLYTGVSDCNMEEGSLRCDANVSIRLRGAKEFGTSRVKKPQLVPVSAKKRSNMKSNGTSE